MLIILELMLLTLLIVAYYSQNRTFICPSFIFVASFAFSVAWSIAYSDRWMLELNNNTFWVIFGGAIVFVTVSYAVHKITKDQHNDNFEAYQYDYDIPSIRQIIFIVISIFTILITIQAIKDITGQSDFAVAVNLFRNSTLYSERLPILPYYLSIIVRAAGYWYSYFIGSSIGYKRRIHVLTIASYIVCLVFSITTGGRNDLICMLLAAGIMAIYARSRSKGKDSQPLKLKNLLKYLAFAVLGLTAFAYLTSYIGRTVQKTDYLYYVAIYCGASIKNLNTFLSEAFVHSEIWGKMTFINVIHYIGARFGIDGLDYSISLNYNSVGAYALGNVYTTYYAFIKDFGYVGMLLLVALMAIISQLVFERMKSSYSTSNISSIIYCFIVGLLAFSYFSNKFYESIFDMNFIKYIVCWFLLDIVFEKKKSHLKYPKVVFKRPGNR